MLSIGLEVHLRSQEFEGYCLACAKPNSPPHNIVSDRKHRCIDQDTRTFGSRAAFDLSKAMIAHFAAMILVS